MNEIYAVVFSNYEPSEVHSLWAKEEMAQKQADLLDGLWEVQIMMVHEEDPSGNTN